ncbi:hypothetical protein [Breznakiella homolactica]|uniref:Uncharacterized protein n=1 Tax=Breznakiella homolactica TaxID=2798577 RepID=A0A7T7XRR5_9SPIR|nr:hypothetical protein [Breznakiella homolactica]QQO11188.1 hypothetical protein JFL75_09840 [Breznakiella homolactica]
MENHISGTGLKRLFLAMGCILLAAAVYGQAGGAAQENSTGTVFSPAPENGRDSENRELPRSFRGISLGMDLDALKDALTRDSYFHFRGDRDVSFLPNREQTLIDTVGFSFIRRAYFQLRDGAVFIMAFTLDPNLIDHYSVFTAFTQKYGEPEQLDPKQAVWVSGTTRVSIERPLTVKYIDMPVFNDIIEESSVRESGEVYLRQEFLDGF